VLHPADLGGNEEGRDLKQELIFCCIFFTLPGNNHFLEDPETAYPLIESRMIKNLICTCKAIPIQAYYTSTSFQKFGAPKFLGNRHMKAVRLQPYALAAFRPTSQEIFLVLISVRGSVDPG
jgi:hypothetical protein